MEIKHMDTFTGQGYIIASSIVNRINDQGGQARIFTTWMDYGQGWAWETILVICPKLKMEYQLMTPRDFREMNEGTITEEKINQLVERGTK
jgi:hypothetical protein